MGRALRLDHPPGATPLDPDEVAGLIPASIATQGELDAFEQANIADAERWALGRRRRGVLADDFVRDLHRRMFCQVWRWAGTYRRSDKNLGEPWPRVPVKVRELCDDASYWIEHESFHWVEIGARFHHRLVGIHPFPNGNGRHARLMTDVVLKSHDQPIFSWGRLRLARAGVARARYIRALQAADRRDYAPLIDFVTS